MSEPVTRPAKMAWRRAAAAKAGDLLPFLDFAGLLQAALLTPFLCKGLLPQSMQPTEQWPALQPLLWLAALTAAFVLYEPNFSPLALARRSRTLLRGYVRGVLMLLGIMLALSYTGGWLDIMPAPGMLLWLSLAVFFTGASRVLLAMYLRQLARLGALTEEVAVIGTGAFADQLIPLLQKRGQLLGVFDDRASRAEACVYKAEAGIQVLLARAATRRPDRAVIAMPSINGERLRALVAQLGKLQIPVELCIQNVAVGRPADRVGQVLEQLPVVLLADRPIKRWNAVLKSASDLLLASVIALLLLPVLACIALAIRIDSPGPILFKQRRHGINNREFDIYKFRTMRYSPQKPGATLQQTVRGDPRITRVGSFLRKWSLDELPQVFNVLRGDMSLVGPRPHAVNMRTEQRLGHEVVEIYPHRHRVKPGITGWSQVNGSRGATDTVDQLRRRVALDIHYIDHWSLLLDLKILSLTFKEVIKATNAY